MGNLIYQRQLSHRLEVTKRQSWVGIYVRYRPHDEASLRLVRVVSRSTRSFAHNTRVAAFSLIYRPLIDLEVWCRMCRLVLIPRIIDILA